MSTEAGRPRTPHVPLPPAVPPRPAAPPRSAAAPPRLRTEPRTEPRTDSRPAAPPRGAEPIPQDEPTTRVTPRPRKETAGPPTAPAPRTVPDPRTPSAPRTTREPAEPRPPEDPPPATDGVPRPGTARARTAGPPGAVPPPPRRRPDVPGTPPPPAQLPRPAALPSGDDISGPPTFRLRPIRVETPRRPPTRSVSAVVCLVLGVGLLGGTTAGTLLGDDAEAGATRAQQVYADARVLWHSVPVNTLFPRTVRGKRAGPGGADRVWIRVAVAPDGPCRHAFDPLLAKVLAPVGCRRLIRATYADETSTSVITVGVVFTEADPAAMRKLRDRFTEEDLRERTDLMPRTFAPRGTVAADFGDAQRASWTFHVVTRAPVIVYAVSGFADGRTVGEPRPAAEATDPEATTAPAQAGLGHDAEGLAGRIEKELLGHLSEPGEDEAE